MLVHIHTHASVAEQSLTCLYNIAVMTYGAAESPCVCSCWTCSLIEQRVSRLTKMTAEVNRRLVDTEGRAHRDNTDVEYDDQYMEIDLS